MRPSSDGGAETFDKIETMMHARRRKTFVSQTGLAPTTHRYLTISGSYEREQVVVTPLAHARGYGNQAEASPGRLWRRRRRVDFGVSNPSRMRNCPERSARFLDQEHDLPVSRQVQPRPTRAATHTIAAKLRISKWGA